jgi:hypothetical protein
MILLSEPNSPFKVADRWQNEDDEQDCRDYEAEFVESLLKCTSQPVIVVTIHNCTFQGYQDKSRVGASSNQSFKGLQDSRQSRYVCAIIHVLVVLKLTSSKTKIRRMDPKP